MPDLADRTLRAVLGRSLITTATWLDDLRSRLANFLTRKWQEGLFQFGRVLLGSQDILNNRLWYVRDAIHHTNLSSWIVGLDWGWNRLPETVKRDWEKITEPFPELPPIGPDEPPEPPPRPGVFSDGPEEIRFPRLEEAAKRLLSRKIVSRAQFDEADERFRDNAFTITTDMGRDTIETIRDELVANIQEGTSLDGFRDRITERLGTSPIGDGHLENVYRTGVQTAPGPGL